MGLALEDMRPRTIVDRVWKLGEKGKMTTRQEIARGIIVNVEGDIEQQSVTAVYVKFRRNDKPEKIDPAELAKVYPHTSKPAREAWRRLMGGPRDVGMIRMNKAVAVRPTHRDELGVTPIRGSGPGTVEPEGDNYGMDGLLDGDEPLLAQDAPETVEPATRAAVPVDPGDDAPAQEE